MHAESSGAGREQALLIDRRQQRYFDIDTKIE
jgi:hypothetical protein